MKTSGYKDFLQDIYSSADLNELIEKLEHLRASSFKTGDSFEKKVITVFNENQGKILLNIMEQEKISVNNPLAVVKYVENLLKGLKIIPTVQIRLAILPTKDILEKISDWLIENLGGKCVIDVTVDPTILGGVILESGGLFRDYSLAKRVDGVLGA